MACYAYAGVLAQALTRLKYTGERALAGPLGRALAADPWLTGDGQGPWTDVVAIPAHRRRARPGPGDHAERIVDRALAAAGLGPRARAVLARTESSAPQVGESAAARRRQAAKAFRVVEGVELRHRAVLVVDDVTTTGATLRAACATLRAGGAARVGALALMRTLPES